MNLMSFLLDAATVVETAAEQNENNGYNRI